MFRRILTVTASALVGATIWITPCVAAEETVGEFVRKKAKDKVFSGFVIVTLKALQSANAVLLAKGQVPLFCMPTAKGWTKEQFVLLLVKYVNSHPDASEVRAMDWPVVMIAALEDAYPCDG